MIKLSKTELLAEYSSSAYVAKTVFASFSEYRQYAQCVSGLRVGDLVELYTADLGRFLTSEKSTETVSAVVIATGHKANNILLGRGNVGVSFYTPSAGVLTYYEQRSVDADKFPGVFYIKARRDIQARVAKIVKAKDAK
jgi:hypothetical protein